MLLLLQLNCPVPLLLHQLMLVHLLPHDRLPLLLLLLLLLLGLLSHHHALLIHNTGGCDHLRGTTDHTLGLRATRLLLL